jgi:hypothetical protein
VSTHVDPPRRRPGPLGTGLILLALWVQLLAPMATLRMALAAPDMPGAILCGHAPGGDAIAASADWPVAPHDCDVCRLCRAGMVPPPLPAVPSAARLLRWTAPAWPIPPPSDPRPAPRVVGQPRAPPITA